MNASKSVSIAEKLHNYSHVQITIEDVKNALEGTSFYEILSIKESIVSARPLFYILYEHYDVESGTFRLGQDGNVVLFFGLQDIYRITGLPIDDKPVYIENNADIIQLEPGEYFELFGLQLPENGKQHLAGLLGSINDFNKFNGDRNSPDYQNEVDKVARKMALVVIGSLIFLDRDRGVVSTSYAPLLRVVGEIKNYAWGAVALADVHSSLVKLVKYPNYSSLMGCVSALMVFAFIQIPRLVPVCFRNAQTVNSSTFAIF